MEFNNQFLLFDGAMGTMLQQKGLKLGELPELLNLTNPDIIRTIHKEYVEAGSNVISTNTFGANRRKLGNKASVEDVITAGVRLAKESGAEYVALDIGQIGALLEPLGTMTFDEAYDIFSEQIRAGVSAGADFILIETISDLLEAKVAILAAKENSDLPVFVSMTLGEDGRTFLGTDAKTAAITLSSLGASAVGLNCSLGPNELLPFVEEVLKYSTVPVIVQANAGLPQIENDKTIYNISANEYSVSVQKMIEMGVSILGGCCGTTPEYIKEIKKLIENIKPVNREVTHLTAFTSSQQTVILDNSTAIIGERINPTGKKLLKQALKEKNYEYIVGEAISQHECGADVLDVNAGLPDIDEVETLKTLVKKIQSVSPLPLQIDSSDPVAVEQAVRVYCGKPIINSVNGKQESMNDILPIVKKYGTAVVALTLDENGIPETAEGRFKIAEKILNEAIKYGIPKEDILIDCLVLTASTNQAMVMETLNAIKLVKSRLGLKTVLGVSNVSFGLPNREIVNSTFLAAAFGAGLDMPILNPLSTEYMKVVNSFKVLNNEDIGSVNYIEKYGNIEIRNESKNNDTIDLESIILSGRKGLAADATKKLLETQNAIEIINNHFIPALNIVGNKYEKGELFLPQLMASAETVKCCFDVLKSSSETKIDANKGTILLATVKGDIHDIGKNIVKMLLENYGYNIIDLGKDVEPQLIVDTVLRENIKLVGLSALMTTTVKYMEETIRALKQANAPCQIVVGGAVLTPEYAKMVGADFYAKDAAESARIAAKVFNN